jgi:16S rRNA (adenine1518-N6/adenine1519-N6)-dimethyltransferase
MGDGRTRIRRVLNPPETSNLRFIRVYAACRQENLIFGHTSRRGVITLQALKGMYILKKSLGQHFLHDDAICRKIVDALPVTMGMKLWEIGPGGGALTRYLKDIPGIGFHALEIDREKIAYLLNRYPDLEGRLKEGDILKEDPPFAGSFSLIGNFPYNISSQILFRVLEWKARIPTVVGMFQKEVAQRIASGPGNKSYGILSVLVQAYYQVEYLFEVDQQCFTPPPKVKSAVIRLRNLGDPYQIGDVRKFTRLVKAAFGQRRKMLRNPLKPFFSEEILKDPFFSRRAETLSIAEFVNLSKQII